MEKNISIFLFEKSAKQNKSKIINFLKKIDFGHFKNVQNRKKRMNLFFYFCFVL